MATVQIIVRFGGHRRNLWDLEGQRAQGCSIQSIGRMLLKALRPSKYRRFYWQTNLEHGNSYTCIKGCKSQPQTAKRRWILAICSPIVSRNCVTPTATKSNALQLPELSHMILAPPKYHPHIWTPPIQHHPTCTCRENGVNKDNRIFLTITNRCAANVLLRAWWSASFLVAKERLFIR